jgi:hypothetical protein
VSRATWPRATGACLFAFGLAAGLVVLLTGFPLPSGTARADTTPNNNNNPYFTLTVSPSATQNLADGQAIPFTVTRTALGTSSGLEIAAVGTGWCASDVQLPVSEDPGNNGFNTYTTGFPLVGAPPVNCLDYVNSDLSAIVSNGSNLPAISPRPNASTNVAGGQGDYPTVSGQALAEVGQGGQEPGFNGISVNCLPSQPCTFALAIWTENVLTPGQIAVYFVGVPVSFVDSSAGLACTSPAAGQINSESPDRLGETITQLGIDACRSGYANSQGLTFNLGSGTSDDQALCAFAAGGVDLAYSGVGYGQQGSAFTPANCAGGAAPQRSYVAVPIALNAVVLAHTANSQQPTPYRSFGTAVSGYPQLKITDAQFAQILSNGGYVDVSGSGPATSDSGTWGTSQLGRGLLALNPSLSSGYQATCSGCAIVGAGSGVGVAATSGVDATTYLATRFLNAVAPTQLASAPDPSAAFPSEPLGTVSNFGAPPPAYDVQTYTGRSILLHYTTPLSGTAWWALTDAATAAATWGGLDDFAVQTSDSLSAAPANATYVAPSTSSMQAAAATMTVQPDGTQLTDSQGGPVGGVEPYPLTYVEYAIAPAQPLLNKDCTANTAAQTALHEWLTYLVGGGQQNLPAGMAPLPSSMTAQAQAAIAKVGTGAPDCAAALAAAGSNATSSGQTPSGAASTNSAGVSGGLSPSQYAGSADLSQGGTGSSASGSKGGKGAGAAGTTTRAAALSLAEFGNVTSDSWTLPFLGILVLTLLVPGLVYLASRRSRGALGELGAAAQAPEPPAQSPVDGGAET